MAINLNTCIGCSACVVACQAENNIPVVGKDQVLDGREMHWIGVDRYYDGDDSTTPRSTTSPASACTARTPPASWSARSRRRSHDAEGLNEMIYNRCVGTRYCSNNCPYKVRHFNFFQYCRPDDAEPEAAEQPRRDGAGAGRDGEVHVLRPADQRSARIAAEIEGRADPRRRGRDRLPGGLPDPGDRLRRHQRPDERGVAKLKADPRNYGLLAELNTRPRTTYLARLTEPEPRDSRRSRRDGV